MKLNKFLIVFFSIVIAIGVFNFGKKFFEKHQGRPKPAAVVISPTTETITGQKEYVGRVIAIESVNLQSNITGNLMTHYFKEGDIVKKGQTLFIVDQAPHIAAVNMASADVASSRAALNEAQRNYIRARELVKKDYISKSQFDAATAAYDRSRAAVSASRAGLQSAQVNLNYTRIKAPITGKIGTRLITEGNLVRQGIDTLAVIKKMNPLYVTFNLSSEEFLNFKKTLGKEDIKGYELSIKLPDGTLYPYKAVQNFYDNQIDETTGTIQLRATIKSPENLLVPGQFVSVVLYDKKPQTKLVLPQSCVLEDSSGKYILVIGEKDTVKYRKIEVSGEYKTNYIVESGLNLNDKVVIKGFQNIKPEMQVNVITQTTKGAEKNGK